MHLVWISQKARFEKNFFILVQIRPELPGLLLVGCAVGRIFELALQELRCSHCSAATVKRTPARIAEPCFIPQEDEIRLDREAFLHHALYVVNLAIKGAIGKDKQSGPAELSFSLELQQGLFD